jgi:cell division protein FtsW (lipid II flippase)
VFLILLRPLGFVVAATALFVMIARALDQAPGSRRRFAATVATGLLFSLVVYLAFTRGLDLPLPGPWTR